MEWKSGPGMPNGVVWTRFIVGRDGAVAVAHSYDADPTIPKTMVGCIANEFLYLHFPQPSPPGRVKVTYPIDFQPDP